MRKNRSQRGTYRVLPRQKPGTFVFEDYNCPGRFWRGTQADFDHLRDEEGGCPVVVKPEHMPHAGEILDCPAWWTSATSTTKEV